jgi:hypothetical protein
VIDRLQGTVERKTRGVRRVSEVGGTAQLRFVRLRGLRFVGAMTLQGGQFVQLVAWPSPHLLSALLGSQVLGIDPAARRVLWRRSINGSVVDVESAAGMSSFLPRRPTRLARPGS